MPVKLVGSLIVAAIAALFTGYNLDNKCNVWIFHTFEQVPVALTIIVSLMTGVIITLPFTFGKNAPRKPTEKDMALLRKAERKEARQKLKDEKRAAKEARQAEKAALEAQKKAEKAASDASAPVAQPTTVEYADSGSVD
ncbi:MAG: hypothetical protein IJR93_01370 [Treponema sp.]|nr:hypothetical protein [Treponema sp.]MBQ7165583.1 hypothetical protein [Treponema sp.]